MARATAHKRATLRNKIGRRRPKRRAAPGGSNVFAGLGLAKPNFAALSPADFLWRTAAIHARRTAIIHGQQRFSYTAFLARARRASPPAKVIRAVR